MFEENSLITFFLLFVLLAAFVYFIRQIQSSRRTKIDPDFFVELTTGLNRLSEGQQQLEGRIRQISEMQTTGNADILKNVDSRLNEVQKAMSENLVGSATKTAHTLGELKQRLITIDQAQNNIEKLSGSVLSLQDILSNKQARGAFGEIQLNDIVSKALPSDSYSFQASLSNGRRVDCLINLPNPPGPISIDSKFPLESFEALRGATSEIQQSQARQNFKSAVRTHIKAISERYIVEGETSDGALMFIPSEAVYAELHSTFPEVVREGFNLRVWIVSPTTCMATLNTMRSVLKDARMREQAGQIRSELSLLQKDVERLETRASNLRRHFDLVSKDVEDITVSAKKASQRAIKLDRFEFEDSERESRYGIEKD